MTTTPIPDETTLMGQLDAVLTALEQATGVKGELVTLQPGPENRRTADALIDFNLDGHKRRYAVEAKMRVDRLAALGQIKAQLDHLGERALLFAPYITPELAKQCRQLDIPFLDIAGNAYLREPGLYVYVTGEKPRTPLTTRGAGTATALRVAFVLLCNPNLLNAPYRDIVHAADVALGAIGWVFFDLEGRGYIAGRQKKHNRRFINATRLFDEWVTNYPIKLRPKLNPRRFRADNPDWWKQADLGGLEAYWGGEIAGQRLTNYLKPAKCTIYMRPDRADAPTRGLTQLVARHRLRPDPQGDIEVLDAFWQLPPNPEHPDVVPPILAYADLIATLDPRNLEVAKLIHDKYINTALR